MPRAKIETAFLGAYTVAALDAAPEPIAGALIKRLVAWILRDELPADLAPELRAPWAIIEEESRTIHARWKQLQENGAKGGRPKANQTEPNGNQMETKGKPNGNQRETKIKIKSKNTPANAGETRETTTRACEDFPDCPIPADRLRVLAAHIGATDKEVEDWRNYYTAQEWRFKPVSPRPMTQAAAEASLRNWHAMQGIREAREAHLDAKADERHAAALAQRNGPPPPDFAEAEARRRAREEEFDRKLEAAKAFMP